MLRSKAKWNIHKNTSETLGLSLSPLTERLLSQRGVTSDEEAKRFLSPDLNNLHDPFLLKGMKEATFRVKQAIENQEQILIFGDYDADGVSSTAVMVEALTQLGANVTYYIPNRFTEGYGPNETAFREAYESGITLIITVDTGIAANNEAKLAKELGIDLIITDHHEAQDVLPDTFATIHPKLSPDYPFNDLAGVGVAFKFAHALLGDLPTSLLDFVVIGTIADLVPLVDENRILAYHGLKALTHTKRDGLKALKEVCGIEGTVTEEDIGFSIGPRINAVGRLQAAYPAVELMLTDLPEEALELATMIQRLNEERQKIVSDIAKEAEKMIEQNNFDQESVLILAKEGWNPGVLGIVASRLVNKYDKPAIVLSIDEDKGEAKGSARSIDAFDLFLNCMEVRDLFINFGGHSQAAGMTLTLQNISILRKALNKRANEQLTQDDFRQVLTIDSILDIKSLSIEVIEEINKLAPFGMSNPKPLFQLENHVPSDIRQIGSKLNHLKLLFKEESKELDAIGFGLGEHYSSLSPHAKMSVVGELSINEWNGRRKMQIMMKDIKVDEWQLFDYRGSNHLEKLLSGSSHKKSLAVFFDHQPAHDHWISNQFDVLNMNNQTDLIERDSYENLYLFEMPNNLEQLKVLVQKVKPKCIFACYRTDDAQFLKTLPNREHFKWFYGMLLKRKQFDIYKDGYKLTKHKGWTKDTIEFITQVFFELEFVKINNGLVTPNPNPNKKDLTESKFYQTKQAKINVEEILYFSTYKELKLWFDQQLEETVDKEEVVHGL